MFSHYLEEMRMDEKSLLYSQIIKAIRNGNDAEVRRDKNGNLVEYTVKRQRTDKIKQ